MAAEHDILDRHKGEAIEILLSAKAPGGAAVIDDPNNQVITINVSKSETGDPLLSFSASPQVVLVDAGSGQFLIQLTENNLAEIKEKETYYYNVWSKLGSDPSRLQLKGKLRLGGSIK